MQKETLQALRAAFPLLWSVMDRVMRRQVVLSLSLLLLASLLTAVLPVIFKAQLDRYTEFKPGTTMLDLVPYLIAAYVGFQFLAGAIGEVRGWIQQLTHRRVRVRLSSRLYRHALKLPLNVHINRQSGTLSHELNQGLQGYENLMEAVLFQILPICIELLAIVFVLLQMQQFEYLAVFTVGAALYMGVFIWGATSLIPIVQRARESIIAAHNKMTSALLVFEAVKCFRAEQQMADNFDTALVKSDKDQGAIAINRIINGLLVATISAGTLGTVLFIADGQVKAGAITVGMFVLLASYSGRLMAPLQNLGSAFREISQGVANSKQLAELLRTEPETDTVSAPPGFEIRGGIEFRNVYFDYGPDAPVFDGLSFKVSPGETVAIVGMSGAGKSTLIRALNRTYPLKSGEILIDDVPNTELPLSMLRNAISVVLQDTTPIYGTVRENIAFGRPDADQAAVEAAAKAAHLHERILRFPEGYDTLIGERGHRLSGGERQRLAIARAIFKGSGILILDEATASLDGTTERAVMKEIDELSQRYTTLVIAHRLSTIARARRVIVIEDGRVLESGTPRELLAKGGAYAKLYADQTAALRDPADQRVA